MTESIFYFIFWSIWKGGIMSILSSMFQNGVSIDAYPEVQGMPDREKYSTINDIIVEENKAMTKDYTSMSCFERASILKLNLKKFVPVLKHNIYGYPYISGFKLKPDCVITSGDLE